MKFILLLKILSLLVISMAIFYIFEYGFNFDSREKLITPILLSMLATLMFFKPNLRLKGLILAGICLGLMILVDLFGFPIFSKILGDFGFSLLVITVCLYLPQIIKKGYVESL